MGYPVITAGELLDAMLQANGFDPDHTTLTAKELAQFTLLADGALRRAWEAELWPQLMVIERRTYRPAWAADVPYSEGHEVYYTGMYWRSESSANLGHAPALGSALWTEYGSDMIPYIAFDQPWEARVIDETGVDWPRCVFDDDPLTKPAAVPVAGCRPFEQSILVPLDEAPVNPYVRFRPTRPRIGFVEWAAGTAYATGVVRYRSTEGQCYVALRPSTGATPESSAEDWAPVGVPEMFAEYIRERVRAERAADDEGKYKLLAQADMELERVRETYMHVSGERGGRKVRWMVGR